MPENIHELDKKISVLQIEVDLKFKARDEALIIETKELARRLEILNGEATRLRDIQATYLPREVAENALKEIGNSIDDLKAFKNNFAGRQGIVTVVVSIIVSLTFLFIGKFLNI